METGSVESHDPDPTCLSEEPNPMHPSLVTIDFRRVGDRGARGADRGARGADRGARVPSYEKGWIDARSAPTRSTSTMSRATFDALRIAVALDDP